MAPQDKAKMHKHVHKRDARAHAQAHTCTKNKTSILSDASLLASPQGQTQLKQRSVHGWLQVKNSQPV